MEQAAIGGVALLTLHGTVDQEFVGKKIADSVRSKRIVLDMRDVRRFASWGMSEWMTFLRTTEGNDVYIVECSTYAVAQINLVTGLLGHAKLVSFYASYRCTRCNSEIESPFIIPNERELIRDLPDRPYECPKCGGAAKLEEFPAAFFDTIADRPPFDIDDDVVAFLRSHFGYEIAPQLSRFRGHRKVIKGYTYLRMSGSLATLPAEQMVGASHETTVVDLATVIFDPGNLAAWRTYVETAMPKLTSLQLMACPPGFLEHGIRVKDLHEKLKIRSFVQPYDCVRCNELSNHLVDVAENLEQLSMGLAPTIRCGKCSTILAAVLPPQLSVLLRALPARDRDTSLDAFLEKSRRENVDKLENCLTLQPKVIKDRRAMPLIALGLGTLILAGLGVVAYGLWTEHEASNKVAVAPVGLPQLPQMPPPPKFERPEWIVSEIPSSAFCQDMINRLMCIGVSSYSPTRDQAVGEANDAALEELVNALSLKVSDSFFRDKIIPAFNSPRTKALSDLQTADIDRNSTAYAEADKVANEARHRVVEAFQASGGAAVPSQRSDWHWEQYAAKGGGTETLVFVRYDVSLDAIRALVSTYSEQTTLLGSKLVTAFPELSWGRADFHGGVLVVSPGGPLAAAGIKAESLITAVGEHTVTDVTSLAKWLDDWKQGTGNLSLTVKTGDDAPRTVEIRRSSVR